MIVFSLFVQASEGATYGIVPYVDRQYPGCVSGIVGAGGNVGATAFGLALRQLNYSTAFNIMGGTIIASAFLSFCIFIKGESNMFNDGVQAEEIGAEAKPNDWEESERHDPDAVPSKAPIT